MLIGRGGLGAGFGLQTYFCVALLTLEASLSGLCVRLALCDTFLCHGRGEG